MFIEALTQATTKLYLKPTSHRPYLRSTRRSLRRHLSSKEWMMTFQRVCGQYPTLELQRYLIYGPNFMLHLIFKIYSTNERPKKGQQAFRAGTVATFQVLYRIGAMLQDSVGVWLWARRPKRRLRRAALLSEGVVEILMLMQRFGSLFVLGLPAGS